MTEFLLVRHGETDWNAERRWQGHADRPLNERGRAQAEELADLLAGEPIDAVYSSDLARARETADVVAARLGAEVRALRELREIDVGEFSGLTAKEVAERHPDAIARLREHGYGWTGGETTLELEQRVLAALRRIAAEHPDGRVLIVSHGGTIRAVAALASELGYSEYRRRHRGVGNCSVTRIAYEEDRFRSLD